MGFFYRKQKQLDNSEEKVPVQKADMLESYEQVLQEEEMGKQEPEEQKRHAPLDSVIATSQVRISVPNDSKECLVQTELPVSQLEEAWAETKISKKLQQPENNDQTTKEETHKKKRTSLGRTNQIKTRLTDSELKRFRKRVEKSGLQQGEFIRKAVLNNQILIEERSFTDIEFLDEIALLRAELGRQGGLLKMVIKPNEGQRELVPDEWQELIETIRGMETLKRKLSDLERKITDGNSKT